MVESTSIRTFEVPFIYRKHFTPEECTEMSNSFKFYDKDNSGSIEGAEFKQALKDMGHDDVSEDKLASTFKEVDKDSSGAIEWIEFIQMMKAIKVAEYRRKSSMVNVKGLGSGQSFEG